MKSNKDYYGDTATIPTYYVRQLATEIVLPDDQFTFYNTSAFPVNPTILGTRTLGIRPSNADSVNIKMDNTLGTTLFGMLRRKSDTVKINSAFTKFFKGLQLSSNNANVIYGFKDSVVLRMYYHETDNYFQTRTFDFVLNNSNFQFLTIFRPTAPVQTSIPPYWGLPKGSGFYAHRQPRVFAIGHRHLHENKLP